MIVDDDPDILLSLETVLKSESNEFEIHSVKSGFECLQYLENYEVPDLILLDIAMPDISGWSVYDKLKENPKWENIKIIFITARTDNTTKDTGSFLGDDYIEKPFDSVDLLKKINHVLTKNKDNYLDDN
jgi:DNA-binding response OmpR family regulator